MADTDNTHNISDRNGVNTLPLSLISSVSALSLSPSYFRPKKCPTIEWYLIEMKKYSLKLEQMAKRSIINWLFSINFEWLATILSQYWFFSLLFYGYRMYVDSADDCVSFNAFTTGDQWRGHRGYLPSRLARDDDRSTGKTGKTRSVRNKFTVPRRVKMKDR